MPTTFGTRDSAGERAQPESDWIWTVGKMAAVVVLICSVFYWQSSPATWSVEQLLEGVHDPERMVEHGKNLSKPQLIKVLDGVHMAHGYTLANSILIEAPEGLIVIDTTERASAAKQILEDYRKISKSPVKAIIFTHNHIDHVLGATSFLEDANGTDVEIWGHETLESYALDFVLVGPRAFWGAAHQFGTKLGAKTLSCGIGYTTGFDQKLLILPNKVVKGKRLDTKVAGLKVTFLHVPGETNDQMAVWIPDRKILMPGDNIYRTFPNLYAIRGVQPRNVLHWHKSLKLMSDLKPEYLVPSHTLPLVGSHLIHSTFKAYMAGIQFVHDQTVRHLNKALHPDDIAHRVQLPSELANHEYLWQYYGTIPWSVKAVYENYIGWFSGDPVELFPNPPTQRARMMTQLIGERRLLSEAESVLKDGSDLQWGLELVTYVFRAQPDNTQARDLRWRILKELAGRQENPLARNFYLTAGLNDHKVLNFKVDTEPAVQSLGMDRLLELMKHRLKAEEVEGVNLTIVYCFTDTKESFKLQIEYSVLLVDKLKACPDDTQAGSSYQAKLSLTTQIFKDILLKKRQPITAYLGGHMTIAGSKSSLTQFLGYLETD